MKVHGRCATGMYTVGDGSSDGAKVAHHSDDADDFELVGRRALAASPP